MIDRGIEGNAFSSDTDFGLGSQIECLLAARDSNAKLD
jgi:hypothetical protein